MPLPSSPPTRRSRNTARSSRAISAADGRVMAPEAPGSRSRLPRTTMAPGRMPPTSCGAAREQPADRQPLRSPGAAVVGEVDPGHAVTVDAGDQIALETSSSAGPLPTNQFYFTVTAQPIEADGTPQASLSTPEWARPVE